MARLHILLHRCERRLPHAGVSVAITLEAIHVEEAIKQALAQYSTPEIVNTDQSSPVHHRKFTRVVLDAGCRLSMDGRGAWRGNVFVARL